MVEPTQANLASIQSKLVTINRSLDVSRSKLRFFKDGPHDSDEKASDTEDQSINIIAIDSLVNDINRKSIDIEGFLGTVIGEKK